MSKQAVSGRCYVQLQLSFEIFIKYELYATFVPSAMSAAQAVFADCFLSILKLGRGYFQFLEF